MDLTATVVLPIHNGERRIASLVSEVLEMAEALNYHIRIVIVDDGSTDGTYEAACDLAVAYPQIQVLHQPVQRGLGPALDRVRRLVPDEQVIVHDGVSPLEMSELLVLLRKPHAAPLPDANSPEPAESRGSRRFAAVSNLHAAMERAHQPLTSVRWLQLSDYVAPRRVATTRINAGQMPRHRTLPVQ